MNGLTLRNLTGIAIAGTGTAFPAAGRWIDNATIHRMIFGDEWQQAMAAKNLDPLYYEQQLGFSKRFWVHTPGTAIVHDELTSADLMTEAARHAIEDSGINKEDIDFVIAVTITSPRYSTSMGPYVSGRLGIHAPSMEMKSGCASNIFSLTLAAQLIQNGAKNVLITCGETNTKVLKMTSRMAYAGGDAGAAVVVSKAGAEKGIMAGYLNSNGSFSGHMGVPGLLPPNQQDIDEEKYYLEYSDAAEDFLNEAWTTTPQLLYKATGLTAGDIDCLIPHQVHKKRTQYAANAAGVPMEKTIDIIHEYANCGSASLLLALDHAKKRGGLEHGRKLMLLAAGGGISWGGLILTT